MGIAPAKATALSMPGISNTNIHVVPELLRVMTDAVDKRFSRGE
jgi:hypothetical protein